MHSIPFHSAINLKSFLLHCTINGKLALLRVIFKSLQSINKDGEHSLHCPCHTHKWCQKIVPTRSRPHASKIALKIILLLLIENMKTMSMLFPLQIHWSRVNQFSQMLRNCCVFQTELIAISSSHSREWSPNVVHQMNRNSSLYEKMQSILMWFYIASKKSKKMQRLLKIFNSINASYRFELLVNNCTKRIHLWYYFIISYTLLAYLVHF